MKIPPIPKFCPSVTSMRALVLSGDRPQPCGVFKEAFELIQTGELANRGIRSVAFACFPEGHPRISSELLQKALEAKLAAAAREDLGALLISQFLFDARPLLAYARFLRTKGIVAPLHRHRRTGRCRDASSIQ